MKKRMKGLLLGTAIVLALTGCGSSVPDKAENITEGTAEEYVQAAHMMLEEADSFAADFKAEVQMKGSDKTVTKGTVELVKAPLYMRVDTGLDFGDLKQEYSMYLEEADDAVNQYMSYNGEWTEMTMTKDAALESMKLYHTADNLQMFLDAAEGWTMEKYDDEIILNGMIPEAKVFAVEETGRLFQLAGMSGLAEKYFAGVGDVPVEIALDAKTGAPISYEIDLAKALETMTNNVLTELGGGKLEDGVEVKKYAIGSELTQLGGVEAGEIPAEAKSDAINYEKEISLLEDAE